MSPQTAMRRLDQPSKYCIVEKASHDHGRRMEKLTRHWGVDVEQIGFGVQNLGGLLDDVQRMFLFDPPLPVEMVLEKGDVRHALFRFGKELVVGWDVHSRGLNL
jgi:hypothetical protein